MSRLATIRKTSHSALVEGCHVDFGDELFTVHSMSEKTLWGHIRERNIKEDEEVGDGEEAGELVETAF